MKSSHRPLRQPPSKNGRKINRKEALDICIAAEQTYWRYIEGEARWLYKLKQAHEVAAEKLSELKDKASQLPAAAQVKFWAFIENQIKFLLKQDSATFYEVLSHTSPNPMGNPTTVDTVEGIGIAMRSLRVLLIPFQKALQYYYWKNPKPGFEVEKPEFTRKDALYLGLDITLLAMTIAAFAIGAEIPAAAIAVGAAVISTVFAGIQYGKSIYEEYQLKVEKKHVDALRNELRRDPSVKLSAKDQIFLDGQIAKANLDTSKHGNTALSFLDARSTSLGERIKRNVADRFRRVRQALGFGLTMMAIVSASLILAGVVLGPVGVPLIMAGVGLSMTTAAIACGMMIVNAVKRNRDNKREKLNNENFEDDKKNSRVDTIDQPLMVSSTRLITDRAALNDREYNTHLDSIHSEYESEATELPNPFNIHNNLSFGKSTLFSRKKPVNDTTSSDDIEMDKRDNNSSNPGK